MSNDACRQNTTLTWHINSCTPNVMTQRWDFAVVTGCPQEGQLTACHSSVPPHAKDMQQSWKSAEKASKDEQSFGTDSLKVFLHLQFSQAVTPQMLLQSMSWNEEPGASTRKVCLTCARRDQLGCCVQTLPDSSTQVASRHTLERRSPLAWLVLHSISVCAK